LNHTRIFQAGKYSIGQQVQLDTFASQHLMRVLRLKDGSEFILFNGESGEYLARLQTEKREASAEIIEFFDIDRESRLHITLLQGVSKGDHMDLSLQKSVELGVSSIQPVICERSVVNLKADRLEKKMRHWQGILRHACEQSGRTRMPELSPPVQLNNLDVSDDTSSLKLLLDPLASETLDSIDQQPLAVHLLIGPEGGLSQNEIQQVSSAGFRRIKMGNRILRTETAAIAALSVMQILWGDFRS